MSPTYADKLIALRRARKIHLTTAAAAMHMRRQTLKELENGKRQPYELNRLKIGEFYGVDPDTLEPIVDVTTPTDGQAGAIGSELLRLSKLDTVSPSTALEPERRQHEGSALLRTLSSHHRAMAAVHKIVAALHDFPDLERDLAAAVEQAITTVEQSRTHRPKVERRAGGGRR